MGAQRPHKRRRMVTDPTAQVLKPQTVLLTPEAHSTASPSLICSTCCRSFRPPKGFQALCSRCALPACTICSRTCTASQSSVPPTPSLTRSPTPIATPLQSPQRAALSLQPANTNIPDSIRFDTPRSGKRRKHEDEEVESSKEILEQVLCDYALGPGCNRVICQRCCVEDMRSETVTCVDCQDGPLLFS